MLCIRSISTLNFGTEFACHLKKYLLYLFNLHTNLLFNLPFTSTPKFTYHGF